MMILIVGIVLSIITLGVITYPLFFDKIQAYRLSENPTLDYNESDSLLAALHELEEDHQLGRISSSDYERLKLHFQHRYLKLKQSQPQREA